MKTMVVVVVLLFAGCKEKDKDAAREIAQSVKEKTIEAKDKVVGVSGELLDAALAKGKLVKVELDKVYKTDKAYDLAVDDAGSADAAVHAAKLEAMPSVEINGVRVGYEEDSNLSLRGTTYSKHFRASWKRGDKIVRVSFFTKETMDLVQFVELLKKVVPIVQMYVK